MSNVLLYSAVGDALGMPFETIRGRIHEDLPAWEGEMRPGTWHKLKAGAWTDDTAFSLALAESMIQKRGFDRLDAMVRYADAVKRCGAGSTLKAALKKFADGEVYYLCGISGAEHVGSGTAMRAAPIGVVYHLLHHDVMRDIASDDARLTHDEPEACVASYLVTRMVQLLLADVPIEHALRILNEETDWSVTVNLSRAKKLIANHGMPDDGRAKSIVLSALTFLLAYEDPTQGLIQAIKYGGDTDTRGAVLGAFYGAIPGASVREDWLDTLEDAVRIRQIDMNLLKVASNL